jgi:hypothetical protein
MMDLVIPTMWYIDTFVDALESYVRSDQVNRIILINNNPRQTPDHPVLKHPKIHQVSYGRNIFVNPAWNEGYLRSTTAVFALINDDITVDPSVFQMVLDFGFQPGDIAGVNLQGRQNNYQIDQHIDTTERIVRLNYDHSQPIGGQAWAFGICMFMHRETYKLIPSLYKVWYGDDYLVQNAKRVFAIESDRIKGRISETLTKNRDPDSEISVRIELDSVNLLKYGHFVNGSNWDIPRNMIQGFRNERAAKRQKKPVVSSKSTVISLADEYQAALTTPSDINQNLPVLRQLADECKTIVEMGVRTGVSTRAFLASDAELMSFDVVTNPTVQRLFDAARSQGKQAQYIQADVLKIEIDQTDLLFIDTYHTYEQLTQELALHGNRAKKYLVFHDTYTYGLSGESGTDRKGLLTAIIEFVIKNPHWRFRIHRTNNNGLTVLERINT